ncbi:PilZ domain-containing protein [Occallatibacter savannae]|uniref:PilZ domain-containing protein n=1 Tax=Occallatibacter savannae TaxID=1002691 RepID=UPI000D688C4C|nr:PilZ domain-containing protein [Occallatibacter savannae]
MLKSDPCESADRAQQFTAEPAAETRPSPELSDLVDWDRLARHPRLEPIVRRFFSDQRKFSRLVLPNVVGYIGTAHSSRPHRIADISVGGFCMIIDDSWTPGTELPITLKREDWDGEESPQRVTVQARVVRSGQNGTGFSIALGSSTATDIYDDAHRIERKQMEEFLQELQKPKAPRSLLIPLSSERPLLLSERTRLLLEIASSYRLSAASELWYPEQDNLNIG